MKIVCDACSAKYSIADEKVRGKVFKIRCKKCSNIIVVRGSADQDEQPQPQFDNKETRVFDYEGGAGGDEPVWHLVIDQEQVGPMTATEVRQRFAAGEIDADTYIWREGFSDWLAVATVEDFADLAAGVPAPAAAPAGDEVAGMFGGPPVEENATMRSDPADLFSAAAAGADAGEDAGADLFGGGAAAVPAGAMAADAGDGMADSLFGASPAANGGGVGAGMEMSEEAERRLRGQRNENSVLFSLNNLAALASDSPKAAAPAAAPVAASGGGMAAGSQPGMAQAGGGEGSGLIDIRSMAQVYLNEKGGVGTATESGSANDLPVFSQTSFDQPASVLLPTAPAANNNKTLYILLGVISALVIAATVLVIMVVKGSGGDGKGSEMAATTAGKAGAGEERGALPGEETPKPAEETGDDAKDPAGDPAEPAAAGDEDKDEATKDEVATKDDKDDKDDKERVARADTKRDRSSRRDRDRKKPDRKPAREEKKPERAASSSGKCMDEVGCLLADKPPPCCSKYGGGKKPSRSRSSGSSSGGGNSNLPESLSRSDISSGMAQVRGRVAACGDKHPGKGQVKVSVKVGSSGSVSSVSVSSAPNSSLGSCVASAVKRARFPKTQQGRSFSYPFVFR